MTDHEVLQAALDLTAGSVSAVVTSIDRAGYPHSTALLKIETV